jgi:uncharacterized protein YjbJ (UPF0337 family)
VNWDQIMGNWTQTKGRFRQQWSKLTNDDLDGVKGHRDYLLGKLQERYGITKEEAERQLKNFERSL